jgi:outer membrane protein
MIHQFKYVFILLSCAYSLCCFADDIKQTKEAKEEDRKKRYQKHTEEIFTRPKWELGVGLFHMHMPLYRGAKESRSYWWPYPAFIYRGEHYQVDNSSLVGNFYEGDKLTLGASLSLSLPVDSGRSTARDGMPHLDPTIEWGPMASWDFWKSSDGKNILSLNLPVRSAWSVNFFRGRNFGTFAVPFFAWTAFPQKLTKGLLLEWTVAMMWASRGYHDYFYSVPEYLSNDSRPAYRAHGGYSGYHSTLYLSQQWKKVFLFGFIRYDSLKGTAFESSPLIQKKDYVVYGLGITFYLFQSSKTITRHKVLSPVQ